MLLKDKVIIITGATSGIGAATATVAAREGARVVVAGRREAKGEAVASRIRAEGGEAVYIRTDVTKEADVTALVEQTVQRYGRLDGAFNNAGIPGPFAPLDTLSMEGYRALMTTNLDAVFACMRHEIPALRATGGGAIVNCASIVGIVSGPTFSPYSAAKAGLLGLTRTAALDYATMGIRVNAVLPGPVDTEIWSHMDNGEALFKAFCDATPVKRHATAEEIGRPVVFLLSEWASYITGASIVIDGGYTAQ